MSYPGIQIGETEDIGQLTAGILAAAARIAPCLASSQTLPGNAA
jgi:hypothetical protein